ncbi:avidin/streptavidin family protein [Bradyrhizobium brasilense]|uniref:avidin/streptavidin family protein n=1 Tax=Bradyrhizobium brasilense TaxID=1419277 RepID=UPI0024C0D1A8|nr:avidin/streptavidin family protein [Bradyrhizobium brasilense]
MRAIAATKACLKQQLAGWLKPVRRAISFTVNFVGCGSTTVWTGQLNSASGFRGLWLLSLAEPVVWNGISAGADTFTFKTGDRAKLLSAGGTATESSAGEKLSNWKRVRSEIKIYLAGFDPTRLKQIAAGWFLRMNRKLSPVSCARLSTSLI